jgi:hypothetical protein
MTQRASVNDLRRRLSVENGCSLASFWQVMPNELSKRAKVM